jgi:hypothetical protein
LAESEPDAAPEHDAPAELLGSLDVAPDGALDVAPDGLDPFDVPDVEACAPEVAALCAELLDVFEHPASSAPAITRPASAFTVAPPCRPLVRTLR